MQNMKNIVLILCLCLSVFMVSCSNTKKNPGKAEDIFSEKSILKNKDYDKKPMRAIGYDIINKLNAGEFVDIEKYMDHLVSEKPYTINGTRVLEELYQFVGERIYSSDTLDKWCAKKPSHHSAFIFRGNYYISLAWKHRGGGLGHTVIEEGRRLFYENLLLAEKDFNKAWSMNPADPNSAASMLTVYNGLRRSGEKMDTWFKRAIAADPVTYSAYANKQNYLRPKWNGSQEKNLAFAEYCSKNAPPKSVVHEIMLDYLLEKASWERKDFNKYFNDPSIKEILNDTVRRTLANFPDSPSLKRRLAIIEIYKGNYSKAVELYSEILKKDPDNPEALSMRAMLYGGYLNKPDLAQIDINRSFESDPARSQNQVPMVKREHTQRIPEETLSHYTGTYEISPEKNVVIALFKTRLVCKLPGQSVAPLFPESVTKFYNPNGKVEFLKDDSGEVTHLILIQDGVEKKAVRSSDRIYDKQEITVPTEILSQYVGHYQVTPHTVLEVTMEGNRLFAQSTGYIKKAISPESETTFFYNIVNAQLEFFRDENGKVSHLVLTEGNKEVNGPRM